MPAAPAPGLASRLLITLIRGYQRALSPYLGDRCRFTPTCSAYAVDAITQFGVLRGGSLAARRIARCQPFCAGGYDPVPERIAGRERHG